MKPPFNTNKSAVFTKNCIENFRQDYEIAWDRNHIIGGYGKNITDSKIETLITEDKRLRPSSESIDQVNETC